jgi:hypothetical protein
MANCQKRSRELIYALQYLIELKLILISMHIKQNLPVSQLLRTLTLP